MPRPDPDHFPILTLGGRLALSLAVFGVYCVGVGLVLGWWRIEAVHWADEVVAIFGVGLGLLMGFRNRVAYERWWEARKLWGQLTNDLRNLAAKLAAFLPRDLLAASPAAALLAAFPVALMRHLRGELFHLRDLPGFESATDDPKHVPAYLAGRLYALVQQWRREGHLSDTLVLVLDPHLRAWLDVCGGCERIRNTPLSPSYKGLLRLGLVVNLLVAPWVALSTGVLGWYGGPVLLVACLFLLGLELIDTVIEEPFGREYEDLALGAYCRTMQESVAAALPGGQKLA